MKDRTLMMAIVHEMYEWFMVAREKREELAARVKALEQFPFEWSGPWTEGKSYSPRAVVTFKGGMWLNTGTQATDVRPGDGIGGWRLCVKAGCDADPKPEPKRTHIATRPR